MVNKYANPKTVLGFAYRFSQPCRAHAQDSRACCM